MRSWSVVGEIDPPTTDRDWQHVVPAVVSYLDSMAGSCRVGGLSADLTIAELARGALPG
ncbi:hypothetical protein [Streptomyces fragilis]|uniref:Uncharacterized protein n=1 Tax=Streptomyces fragilis TaxID=67301 RepID=A0ABV2YPY2_9ACTN|nr:hypothetical protein [Streptomyces fragilis]